MDKKIDKELLKRAYKIILPPHSNDGLVETNIFPKSQTETLFELAQILMRVGEFRLVLPV